MNSVHIKSFILFGMWLAVFSPSFLNLLNVLIEQTNASHGLLVPFISFYFAWQKKEKLRRATISTSSWGAVIVISSLLIYIVAIAGHVVFIARLMMIVSFLGLVLFNYGKQIFKLVAFSIFFLFFMIPIPVSLIGMISLPLQLFATDISAKIINAFSIPVSQEGNMLYFAQTQFEVAQACSGLHSIMAFIMLSTIFVYISGKGLISKIILLASAIPLALLVNIIRITGTGLLAHYYGADVAFGFVHELSGLALFAFGFLILALEYLLLNKFCNHEQ